MTLRRTPWRKVVEKNEHKLQDKAAQYLKEELGYRKLPDYITSEYLQIFISQTRVSINTQKDIRFAPGQALACFEMDFSTFLTV